MNTNATLSFRVTVYAKSRPSNEAKVIGALAGWLGVSSDQSLIAADTDIPVTQLVLRRWLEESEACAVAFLGDFPVCIATATKAESQLVPGTIEICHLIVLSDYRRLGIGTEVISALRDWANKSRYSRAIARIVPSNEICLNFVRQLGWGPLSQEETRTLESGFVWVGVAL